MATPVVRVPSVDDKPLEGAKKQAAPAAAQFKPDPNKWYRLKAKYLRDDGKVVEGCLYPVGSNAAEAFWDYIAMGDPRGGCELRFKQMEGQMWYTAEVKADEYKLCLKLTGWMYRASYYTAGFLIGDDGKLYVDSWSGPLGCANSYKLMPNTYFVGAALPNILSSCELIEVKA
jgi:hypothetical protein